MQWNYPLIRELNELFRRDPDIDELGVIFTVSPPKSPQRQPASADAEGPTPSEPQFILQQHKLGISVHSVHSLINEAREAFPAARRDYLRARREDISGRHTEGKRGEEEAVAAETLLCVTRALLLINADHGSAWNSRKELVSDGVYGNVRGEIKLLDLIFTKHAKSPNAWAHRRWCWRNDDIFRTKRPAVSWTPLEVAKELEVCRRVAELYPKNYYAWTQRSWVVLRFVGSATAAGVDERTAAMGEAHELLKREISFVDTWLTSHVSDHSALNHRKNVVSALAAVSSASGETGPGFVERERSSNAVVIVDYPGHESLWCYRRFVWQSFLVTAPHVSLTRASRQPEHAEDDAAATTTRGAPPEAKPTPRAGKSAGSAVQPARHVQLDAKGDGVSRSTGAAAVARARLGDRYDWPGWNRAVTGWYEGCLRQDAEEQKMGDEEVEDLDDEELALRDDECHGGEAVGELPGAPTGGGVLANFLGREARFALKCASDQGAWQFRQQRRHALAYLAFISYATGRILGHHQLDESGTHARGLPEGGAGPGDEGYRVFDGVGGRMGGRNATGGWVNYCEVTGAPKLQFPLEMGSEERYSAAGDEDGTAQDTGGCAGAAPAADGDGSAMQAVRILNIFVAGLRRADVLSEADSDCRKDITCSRSAIPYAMEM